MCTPGSAESCRLCKHSREKAHKDWSLWSVFQTGQSKLFSHRAILLNSAPFLQLIAGITFIFCATASWKFMSGASSHHLESQKTSLARWRVYTLKWPIKAQLWSPQTQVVVITRSHTHYLGDTIFRAGKAWHQVTIHFLHKNVRFSPVALQFCCLWTYARYIRFVSNTLFTKGWGKGHWLS